MTRRSDNSNYPMKRFHQEFSQRRKFLSLPLLRNKVTAFHPRVKFLGLIFDSRLTWDLLSKSWSWRERRRTVLCVFFSLSLITYGKYFSKQFPPFAIKLPESAELLLVIYTLYKLRKEKDVLFTKWDCIWCLILKSLCRWFYVRRNRNLVKNLSRILAVEFGRNRELLKNQTQRTTFYSPLMHIRCIPDWLEIPAWRRLYIRDKNPTRMTDDLGKLCNTSPSTSHFKLNLCLLTLGPWD